MSEFAKGYHETIRATLIVLAVVIWLVPEGWQQFFGMCWMFQCGAFASSIAYTHFLRKTDE